MRNELYHYGRAHDDPGKPGRGSGRYPYDPSLHTKDNVKSNDADKDKKSSKMSLKEYLNLEKTNPEEAKRLKAEIHEYGKKRLVAGIESSIFYHTIYKTNPELGSLLMLIGSAAGLVKEKKKSKKKST